MFPTCFKLKDHITAKHPIRCEYCYVAVSSARALQTTSYKTSFKTPVIRSLTTVWTCN